jgi:putative transposase
VFFSAADREVYLGLLRQSSVVCEVDVLGHCLMTNHVHLVLLPRRSESLGRLMREVQMRYSQYRHAVERGSGHLWQGRYYSCAVEPDHLGSLMRYVELNPVRARLVEEASQYAWSSAAVHLGGQDRWDLVALEDWRRCWSAAEWAEVLRTGQEDGVAIREATYGGRPLGSVEFVDRLEQFLDRRLKRGVPGRPKKEKFELAAMGGEN